MASLVQHPWRAKWQPASFRGAEFHVEVDSRGGGRRVAKHEYPKRNTGYSEDMGRRLTPHAVEGYVIGPNYLGPRDALIKALDDDGPGSLVHPLLGTMQVMCENFTCTETREKGGMATFHMTFIEAGSADNFVTGSSQSDTQSNVADQAGAAEAAASGARWMQSP